MEEGVIPGEMERIPKKTGTHFKGKMTVGAVNIQLFTIYLYPL
jgi:hypothetical protein